MKTDFRSLRLEEHALDPVRSPVDRFILVAPAETSASPCKSDPDPGFDLSDASSFKGRAGWLLLHIAFHRATDPGIPPLSSRQSIFSIQATPIGVVGDDEEIDWKAKPKTSYNHFYFVIDEHRRTAQLGPVNSVVIENHMAGRGIGSYLLSALITWIKASGFEDVSVARGNLSEGDAQRNGARRDQFYTNHGFNVVHVGTEGAGYFEAESFKCLRSTYDPLKSKKILEVSSSLIGADALSASARLMATTTDLRRRQTLSTQQRQRREASVSRAAIVGFATGLVLAAAVFIALQ